MGRPYLIDPVGEFITEGVVVFDPPSGYPFWWETHEVPYVLPGGEIDLFAEIDDLPHKQYYALIPELEEDLWRYIMEVV